MGARGWLGALIGLVLTSPFFIIVLYSPLARGTLPFTSEVGVVFMLTALQALASAVAASFFGILGALGLLWFARRFGSRAGRWAELITLAPNAAPVLLLLLSVIKLFPWARGLAGIVFVHMLLNGGLIAVGFARLVRTKIAGQAELAWVEGASGWLFFRRGAWPILRQDVAMMFFFTFAVCFASFAVPLALGGSRATTIEVLIYQKIRISADWTQALGLAGLQMFAVLIFSMILSRDEASPLAFRTARVPLLEWAPGLVFALAPALVLIIGLSDGLLSGAQQALRMTALIDDLPRLISGSIVVAFGTGVLMSVLLLAIAFVRPRGIWRKLLIGYAAPSSALVGFALLIVWRALGMASYLKIILGMVMISGPAFYRYQWDALIRAIEGQITVARALGAGDMLIFSRVIAPQLMRPALSIGGFAALWAWGDFALSSVVAEKTITLAMSVQAMTNTYRLEAATFFVWILLLGGLSTFAIFMGAGYVLGEKSQA